MILQRKIFLFGCIPARVLLVVLAFKLNSTYLAYMGYIVLFPATVNVFKFLTNSRKTGLEVSELLGVFGGKIWWNSIRLIHSLLYFAFSYNAIVGNTNAWLYLLADVSVGFSSSLVHYTDVALLASRVTLQRPAHVAINGGSNA